MSSKRTVPVPAAASLPCGAVGPVNAPRAWPNKLRFSINVADRTPHWITKKGLLFRGDREWIKRPKWLLPVPVSPSSKTVQSNGATVWTFSMSLRMAGVWARKAFAPAPCSSVLGGVVAARGRQRKWDGQELTRRPGAKGPTAWPDSRRPPIESIGASDPGRPHRDRDHGNRALPHRHLTQQPGHLLRIGSTGKTRQQDIRLSFHRPAEAGFQGGRVFQPASVGHCRRDAFAKPGSPSMSNTRGGPIRLGHFPATTTGWFPFLARAFLLFPILAVSSSTPPWACGNPGPPECALRCKPRTGFPALSGSLAASRRRSGAALATRFASGIGRMSVGFAIGFSAEHV